jgi:broad-specificity NMP kinase
MISNPFYNNKRPLSNCNSKCISEDLVDANGELIKKILGNKEKECSKCDLIEALNTSNASITINVNSKKTKNIDNEISVVQKKSHLKKKLSDFFSFKKKKKSTLNITTNSVDNSNENSVTNDN